MQFLKKWFLKPVEEKDEEIKESDIIKQREGFFTTQMVRALSPSKTLRIAIQSTFKKTAKDFLLPGITEDSASTLKDQAQFNMGGVPIGQISWYGAQGFIGYQACAMISQHWLVSKACTVPARDAIRKGWEVTVNDGSEIPPDIIDQIRKADDKYKLKKNLLEFVKMGRTFGIRVAMFKVVSSDPEYYEKPFNIDGVNKGAYKGISQIDPYWMAPELDSSAAADPTAVDFYEPTYWNISGRRVHKSHLCIMLGDEVPDILKPTYLYGGVSVPQKIYERVYAAERVANEAPELALSKRTNILKTNAAAALANQDKFESALQQFIYYRDNYGVKTIDKESEDMQQFDTSLADLDAVIMSQYQLAASVANVPVTKLLGTTPKGFNSTGEYEEASYREELESIQAFDLKPLIEKHHQLLIKSEIAPKNHIEYFETETVFNPLDSLTETEQATVNLNKAQTDQIYTTIGAIDGSEVRERLIADPQSGYNGIESIDDDYEEEGESDGEEDFNEEAPKVVERT